MTVINHRNSTSNNPPCDELYELLPAYVMGITDEAESHRVEVLMAECPELMSEINTYESMRDAFLFSAPPVAPSDVLRDKVLRAARQTNVHVPSSAITPVRLQSYRLTFLVAAAAIVTLVVLNIALLLSTVSMQQTALNQAQAQTAMLNILAEDRELRFDMQPFAADAPANAKGLVLCNPQENSVLVQVKNLPRTSREYQVWLLRENARPERGGILNIDENGNGSVVFMAGHPMGMYQYIGVSEKRDSDTPENYTTPVITAALYTNP